MGRDLIQAAKTRSELSQLTSIETTMNTFKAKYNCMASDCANASAFGLGASGNGNSIINRMMEGPIYLTFGNICQPHK